MTDLTNSVRERFLDAMRQHPSVFDTKRMDYRDVERKKNAWEQIRLHAGLSTAIEGSQRSGSGYVSRRTWEFTESMAFYKDCGRPRKTTCSLNAASSSGDGDTVEDILMTMQSSRSSSPMTESSLDATLHAGASTPLLPTSPLQPRAFITAAPRHLAEGDKPEAKKKKQKKKI
ncbi:hypothetical protein V5799_027426 [Amblyomma americanum]|uniref:MADF domain-containing protein n=1 Tax=Amblyomma americanum TaxID=6943 RepID=A0AAQ4DFR4_AMBAM